MEVKNILSEVTQQERQMPLSPSYVDLVSDFYYLYVEMSAYSSQKTRKGP